MPVSIFLGGWEAQGLRCPDHKISFEAPSGEMFPVSLLQMPNGTGKTTTLHLLRAALSGSADNGAWSAAAVRGLARRGTEGGTGYFRVQLMVDGKRITISLNLDFDEGLASYTTTVSSGMKSGFAPPQIIEKFLLPEFVDFFVFDGELAEHLLSRERTDAQRVIENLFQLSLFNNVIQAVDLYYDEQTAGRAATEEKGLSRRANRVQALRLRLANMKQESEDLAREYEAVRQALTRKEAKFQAALDKQREHGEQVHEAKLLLNNAKSRVQALAGEVLRRMRDPHAVSLRLAAEMVNLKSSLDRVKLPESTAREFFEELAEEERCVCNRELTDELRKVIRERAKHYLGSDDVALLNALKSDIANMVGENIQVHEEDLGQRVQTLLDAMRVEDEARTVHSALESEAIASDPELQNADTEIKHLAAECERLLKERAKYESLDESAGDDRTFGIKILERRLEDAERKLAEIANTIVLRKQGDMLREIIASAAQSARAGISAEICREANERISALMPDNSIRIRRVDRCLVLEGQEGGSAGETLCVAYAFLATLFNRVDHRLPFIVDSPANPIDLRVRSKVAELIPRLTTQFVAFTISSERQYFVPHLAAASRNDVQYVTLFRRGSEDLEKSAACEACVEETADGIMVTGKEFFNKFHLDEEDNGNAI